MSRAATFLQAIFRSEPIVAVSLTVAVGGVGVWVTPKAIEALSAEPVPLGEVAVEGDLPSEREAIIEALRTLLEGCYAYVGARDADQSGPATLALWLSDEHERGTLNAGEALLLTHSSLLRTITATYIDTGDTPGKRVDSRDLIAPDATRRFRSYGTPTPRVIATGVQSLSVITSPGGEGEVELALTLTWDAPPDDAADEAGASTTTLRVRLRRVEGVGR